ncbi:unnamed protein product [Schistosoma margrebowiei]|uniref:Uncharacterized protein n=1 Tax=Schistosoma margrebowiei TaxID=48269 RepID=A0A183MPJ5_9TREM|nr:unnamed protein product [Schistosoma margrebowiei]
MRIEVNNVGTVSAVVHLNVHKGKSKIFKSITENTNPITLDGETLEEVEKSTYPVGIIDERGESDTGVNERIGEARNSIPTIEEHIKLKTTVCQPMSKSTQSYYTELEFGKLIQLPANMYKKCLYFPSSSSSASAAAASSSSAASVSSFYQLYTNK